MNDKCICQHERTKVASIGLLGDIPQGWQGAVGVRLTRGAVGCAPCFVFHSDIARIL